MKRAFDVIAALCGLMFLSPIIAIVAILVYRYMGAPVLFWQQRPGYRAKTITVLKFRTMRNAFAPDGSPLSDAERLTRFGKFLRKTSLDELPQLWNVLVGDLSLVGPRPLLMKYLPYYTSREQLRFLVAPGITGWAQVHGRNEAPWDVRLEYDAWYVENWNLWLDLKIFFLTVRKVLAARGVVADPRSHMLDLDEERSQNRKDESEQGAGHGDNSTCN